MDNNKHPFAKLWDDIINEYFNSHPDAGLALWTIPIDEQPKPLKIELYEIFWKLTHKYISIGE